MARPGATPQPIAPAAANAQGGFTVVTNELKTAGS
jgi:hypothetical protein